jgi:hypothetical protein
MSRARVLAFSLIALISVLFAVTYAIRAKRSVSATEDTASGVLSDESGLKAVLANPHVFFRSTRLGVGYGRLVAVSDANPSGPRFQTPLECDRVDVAAGSGACLTADRGMNTSYWAVIFDSTFQTRHRLRLSGIPSRVRLSPDGRLAGITVFVTGHSYSQGSFSTQTTLVDTRTGETRADLETFQITRDGMPFKNADFNFWGVTFAQDSNTFYATLGTGNDLFLIRGDASAHRGEVIARDIECPAISPDNKLIGFKKRSGAGGRTVWRLAVLTLSTSEERLLQGESRSVDDQVEWLDDNRILYSISDEQQGRSGTSIWVADITSDKSALWSDGAYSPAVGDK